MQIYNACQIRRASRSFYAEPGTLHKRTPRGRGLQLQGLVRLRQPESLTDIFLYLGHARAHDNQAKDKLSEPRARLVNAWPEPSL